MEQPNPNRETGEDAWHDLGTEVNDAPDYARDRSELEAKSEKDNEDGDDPKEMAT